MQIVVAPARDIRATLDAYLAGEKMFVVEEVLERLLAAKAFRCRLPTADAAGSAIRLCDRAGREAGQRVSSSTRLAKVPADIHIESGRGGTAGRYRIDGRLVERLRPPHRMRDALTARLKLLAGLDLAQRRLPQDGSIRHDATAAPIHAARQHGSGTLRRNDRRSPRRRRAWTAAAGEAGLWV